jgi:hypothetical protein
LVISATLAFCFILEKEAEAQVVDEDDFPCSKCGKSNHPEWVLENSA